MNKALAEKWKYNYTNNKDALGRKVVCARSKGDLNSLLLVFGNSGNKSVSLGFVQGAIGRNGNAREVINENFIIVISDGSK